MSDPRTLVLDRYPGLPGTDARTLSVMLALLRGETPRWPPDAHTNGFVQDLLRASRHHGTGGLRPQALFVPIGGCPAELRTVHRRGATCGGNRSRPGGRVMRPPRLPRKAYSRCCSRHAAAYTHYPALDQAARLYQLLIPQKQLDGAQRHWKRWATTA